MRTYASFHFIAALIVTGFACVDVYADEPTATQSTVPQPMVARPTLHQLDLVTPEPDGRRPISINPPTFRWPAFAERTGYVEIGQQADLSDAKRFGPFAETFYRPLQPLAPGKYYWRAVNKDNTKRTPIVSFELGDDVARWSIGSWDKALAKVPTARPRILMRPEQLPRLRELARGECKPMVEKWAKWAESVMNKKLVKQPQSLDGITDEKQLQTMRRVYAKKCAYDLAASIETISMLYLLTEDDKYAKEIRRRAIPAAKLDPNGPVRHQISDFSNGVIVRGLAWAYDTLYDQWSDAERELIRSALLARCKIGFAAYKPLHEQHLFGAHAWQHVIQDLTIGALALYDESPEARDWFAWSLKMHVAMYPWFGGADGGSAEGLSYYRGTNALPSVKVAAMFDTACGVNLFDAPWYRNTPYFMLYMQGIDAAKSQFADGSALTPAGSHGKLALTLWAHKLNDPYVTAYRDAIDENTPGGVVDCLRLIWHDETPAPAKPLSELPKARCFNDVGVVCMRSDIAHPDNDIYFEMRSSPYGSYNHAHADQNSFNVVAFGERLIADTGYYHAYGDPHHYGWTVRSRAHNTIEFGDNDQAWRNVDGYGEIVDFEMGDGFVRAVGSCPNAYHTTQVKRFDRHVLWLEPNVYIIADDLETEQSQRAQWLLHSIEKMTVNGNTVELNVGKAYGRLTFFEPSEITFTQTDQFTSPAKSWRPDKKRDYANQWHLTGTTTSPAREQRFVSVLMICRDGEQNQLPTAKITIEKRGVTAILSDGRAGRIDWRR